MAPFIRDGDVITLAPLDPKDRLRLGEVVAFQHPQSGKLVVHRVVARQQRAVLIRGDAVDGCSDGLIPMDSVLGRLVKVERGGRRVSLGTGPERMLIAALSRPQLLVPLWRVLGPMRRALCAVLRRGAD